MSRRAVLDFLTVMAITFALLLPTTVYIVLHDRADHDARTAFVTACHDANKVRVQVLGLADATLNRSRKATQALLLSPSATDDQKRVAAINLASLEAVSREVHDRLPPEDCSYPPKSR